jgi:probable F420-dependent oxidoreductase
MAPKVGVVFPQTEIGNDPSMIRDYAQAVEGMGFSHILLYDHVLGAEHADREPKLREGAYTEHDAFHEVFVLLGFIAAATTRLGLATGVLVLPQRQTALAAKQAAEVDLLSGERLRLGVGTGWNYVEYEALNESFDRRGRRLEEQVALMRRLWNEPLLDYTGEWHRVDRAGLNPRPRRQVPIWMGGFTDPAFKRAVRLADGFIFGGRSSEEARAYERVMELLAQSGRSRADFGIEAIVEFGGEALDARRNRWLRRLEDWQNADADYISVHTMRVGLGGAKGHLDALALYAKETGIFA